MRKYCYNDIAGQRFGKLVVESKLIKRRCGSVVWACKCDCGNGCEVRSSNLRRKKKPTRSCGCLRHSVDTHNKISTSHKANALKQRKRYKEISGKYWNSLKSGAKRRKLQFSITLEHAWKLFIKQDKKCVYLGERLVFALTKEDLALNKQTASLDRINPLVGYIEGNIQWVHKDINRMKMNMSHKEFVEKCKRIANYNFAIFS